MKYCKSYKRIHAVQLFDYIISSMQKISKNSTKTVV